MIKNKVWTLNLKEWFELRIQFSLQNFFKISERIIFLKIIFEFENYFSKNILESLENVLKN